MDATVGKASQAEYWRKLRPNPEDRTRLVGLLETSKADTRLAVWNCVKWARKGVPERIRGSLPTIRPVQEKKTKKAM